MAVHDDCKLKFLELKAKRNHRFIVFKIDERIQQVIVEKVGGPDESYDDFSASMPADECRYAVYDFDFTTDENCQKSKIFFIAWLVNIYTIKKAGFSITCRISDMIYNLIHIVHQQKLLFKQWCIVHNLLTQARPCNWLFFLW